MLFGDTNTFAIESVITRAFDRPSLIGLGYFVFHVDGHRYGVVKPEATALACSLDSITRRIDEAGFHGAPFSVELDAVSIASAFRNALYSTDEAHATFLGMPGEAFSEIFDTNHLVMAPDGDEAFDDGSYVLQFDIKDCVRLIAFRCTDDDQIDVSTIKDVTITSDLFYKTLRLWRDAFVSEWNGMSKEP
jgi:Immunity protein 42